MTLESGKLRHWVTIQRQVDTEGEDGEAIISWEDVETVPAAIEPLSAREFLQSASLQVQVVARITIRFRQFNPAWRLVDVMTGYAYNPAGALPDKDSGREYLTIPVTLGPGEGD